MKKYLNVMVCALYVILNSQLIGANQDQDSVRLPMHVLQKKTEQEQVRKNDLMVAGALVAIGAWIYLELPVPMCHYYEKDQRWERCLHGVVRMFRTAH